MDNYHSDAYCLYGSFVPFVLRKSIPNSQQFIHQLIQFNQTRIVIAPSTLYFASAFKSKPLNMEIKITLFITLVLYAFVISQSFFYLLAMSRVAKSMQP